MDSPIELQKWFSRSTFCWGTGELSRVATYYLKERGCAIKGYVVDEEYLSPAGWMKETDKLFKFDKEVLENEWFQTPKIFLPIGYKRMNKLREEKFNKCKEWGFLLPSLISPKVIIHDDVTLGHGNYIQESYIQTGTEIGDNNTFWSNCHIGHNVKIGNHNWITSHSTLCSSVVVNNNCFIAANSVISPEVELADFTLVGAGSIITKNTQEGDVYIEGRNNKISKKSWELNLT